MSVFLESIKEQFPFICKNMRIQFLYNGKFGQITGANAGGNLKIKFDDGTTGCCKPNYKMRYFDSNQNVIEEYV